MSPSEVIRADCLKRNTEPDALLKHLLWLVHGNEAQILHAGNTVLLLRFFGDGFAELHLFTEDKPIALAKNVKKLIAVIRKSNLKRVYGNADNKSIVSLLTILGVDVGLPDLKNYNWMAIV